MSEEININQFRHFKSYERCLTKGCNNPVEYWDIDFDVGFCFECYKKHGGK